MKRTNQLNLTIKFAELKRIVSGEKKEEYRDSKKYYHDIFKKLDKDSYVINAHTTLLLRAGYLRLKEFEVKEKNGVFFESPIDQSKKYAIIEIEKIRYEQFMGLTKPPPENYKLKDIAYVIYIKSILEHNL